MGYWKERTERVIGSEAACRLASSRVAVFGLGGVGGHAVEALARSGVGAIDLIDKDTVDETNINRQMCALHSTVGKRKTEVLRERILDINPECRVTVHDMFFLPQNADEIDFSLFDYVIDAVDTVTAKLCIVEKAKAAGTPVICSMGTGNRLDPSKLYITDLQKTRDDPLARDVRRELRKRGIEHVKCVCSSEIPVKCGQTPGSVAFVPACAGMLLASAAVRDIIQE